MIEKLAKYLYRRSLSACPPTPYGQATWEELSDDLKQAFMDEARTDILPVIYAAMGIEGRVACPECGGHDRITRHYHVSDNPSRCGWYDEHCPTCHGAKTIPADLPEGTIGRIGTIVMIMEQIRDACSLRAADEPQKTIINRINDVLTLPNGIRIVAREGK